MSVRNIMFSSEHVTEGHPDKLCDQVSDAVLDACLSVDPMSKVACETCAKTGMVLVFGEITTKAVIDYTDWDDVRAEPAPLDRIYANQAMMLNALPFGVEEDGWLVRAGSAALERLGSVLSLQVTGGSSSIRDAWGPLRVAGATARAFSSEGPSPVITKRTRPGIWVATCCIAANATSIPFSGAMRPTYNTMRSSSLMPSCAAMVRLRSRKVTAKPPAIASVSA